MISAKKLLYKMIGRFSSLSTKVNSLPSSIVSDVAFRSVSGSQTKNATAGVSTTFYCPISAPSGYTYLGIQAVGLSHAELSLCKFAYNGNTHNVEVQARNNYTGTINATADATVMFYRVTK